MDELAVIGQQQKAGRILLTRPTDPLVMQAWQRRVAGHEPEEAPEEILAGH